MILKFKIRTVLALTSLLALSASFAARAETLEAITLQRGGQQIEFMLNPAKLVIFGNAGAAQINKFFAAQKIAVENIELKENFKLVTFGKPLEATARPLLLKALRSRSAQSAGIAGFGPVFFKGANLALSTGKIWLYLPQSASPEEAREIAKKRGLILKDYIKAAQVIAVCEAPAPFSILDAVRALNSQGVDAEPELARRLYPRLVPEDEYFPLQWHLDNTGENVTAAYSGASLESLAGADVRAVSAWDLHTGSPEILLAIIDSGTDCTHPELVNNNKCIGGYNAFTGAENGQPPTPQEDPQGGHGTAVAGISAAPLDGVGVVGVCPGCNIIPIRLIDSGKYISDYMILQSFKYAVDKGAAVINNSWGPQATGDYVVPISAGENQGIDYALNGRNGLGTLVVYASGNENLDTYYYGQLKTGKPNVMAVAASNHLDTRSIYSSFGEHIDVAAPSNDMYISPGIISFGRVGVGDLADGYTRSFGGTSSAAPVVTGVAGLILSANPELSAAEASEIIRNSADKIDPDGGFYDERGHSPKYGYGRVNAYRALLLTLGLQNPACENPLESDDCGTYADENCDGYINKGCSVETAVGKSCSTPSDCGEDSDWLCPDSGRIREVCTWNCRKKPCPPGSVCSDGLCVKECNAETPCPEGFACTGDTLGLCLLKCLEDGDCLENEKCDLERGLCALDTDGSIGSRCRGNECKTPAGEQAVCLSEQMGFPDGYCTHTCQYDKTCSGVGKCIMTQYGGICYRMCSFDGDCRPNYICQQAGIRAGTCHRKCTMKELCDGGLPEMANVICDLSSGRCIEQAPPSDDDDDLSDDDDNPPGDDDDFSDDDDSTGNDDDADDDDLPPEEDAGKEDGGKEPEEQEEKEFKGFSTEFPEGERHGCSCRVTR